MNEKVNAAAMTTGSLTRSVDLHEEAGVSGYFHVACVRNGELIWTDKLPNTVTIVGRNTALDIYLASTSYAVNGPYMGLIGTTTTAAVVTSTSDTMASHAGWVEIGGTNAPTYTGVRKTAVWSAASSSEKSLSAALSFAITSSGTAQGAFLVYYTGATSSKDSTAGTLYSAGAFATARDVLNGDTLNVSYTASL